MSARYAAGVGYGNALGVNDSGAGYVTWTLADADNWIFIASSHSYGDGYDSFAGIKGDGTLWGWGRNYLNILGLGDSTARGVPTSIMAGTFTFVALGSDFGFAIKSDGTLWGWGEAGSYQLGNGSTTDQSTPVQIGSATNWASVVCMGGRAIALRTDGTLWSTGSNADGATGQGTAAGYTTTWTQVGTDTDWAQISAGYHHALAIKTDGTLYGWGYGTDYELGAALSGGATTPTQIGSSTWLKAVGIPQSGSIALRSDGALYVTGYNSYGRWGIAGDPITDWTVVPSFTATELLADYFCVVVVNAAGDTYVAGRNATSYSLGMPLNADYGTLTVQPALLGISMFANSALISQALLGISGTITGPMTLTVSDISGTIEAAMTLAVTESGDIAGPMNLAVIPDIATAISTAAEITWSAACTIDGADVSASLIGQARVVIAEGAARVATVSVKPPSGTLSPLDYVGKTLTLDYVWGGAVRLFTGWVDTPEYDFDSGILTLTCSDNLQNRVAALPREDIDELIDQSLYTVDVQGELSDNWDYAQALLSTVQGSIEAGPNGDLRFTSWLTSGGASFSASNLLYQRSRLKLPQRSAIINEVNCTFKYRYPRLRQRNASLGWSGTHIDMAPCGYRYPTKQDFYGAAGGSGWFVTLGLFWPAPAAIPHSSGGFIYPEDGSIGMAVLHLAHRHAQTVTETWEIRYYAPLSIDINGTNASTLVGATDSSFDGRAWESAIDIEPLLPGGGAISLEEWDTELGLRAALAREVMEKIATARMVGSHRTGRVTNATLLNPALDVNGSASISTDELSASGKLAEVLHVMDLDSGSAITEFSIAYFSLGGTGTPPPHFPANPIGPSTISGEAEGTQDWGSEVTQLSTNVFGITAYSDNLMGILINPPEFITVHDVPSIGTKAYPNASYTAGSYPVTGFRIRMPGVDDADRNPIDTPTIVNNWEIAIPEGTLTFTVP